MGRRVRRDDKLTIHYVEPTYASEEERRAAITRAKAAVMELAGLLGRMAAAETIREVNERGNTSTDEAKDGHGGASPAPDKVT